MDHSLELSTSVSGPVPPCTRAAAHRPCSRILVLPTDLERRGGRSFLFVLRVVLARKRQASVAPWSPWYDGTDLVKEMNGSGVSTVMVKRRRVSRQVPGEGVSETGGLPLWKIPQLLLRTQAFWSSWLLAPACH